MSHLKGRENVMQSEGNLYVGNIFLIGTRLGWTKK